jgi:RecB family endonuclease NucS
MPIYRLTKEAITELPKATFVERGVKERADLQRLLKANIGIVAPGVLVISEEFGGWEDSKRRIDLLGIDCDAKLVVIELKRELVDELLAAFKVATGGK